MNISLGIVGLPNVGKSTLFNALTSNDIPAENYPFCTIDPNVGIVPVVDPRLDQLAELVQPSKTTPAVVEFWDIAGLVRGAAQGEGLGNKFLANIRNVSAIVHVVRAFVTEKVTHVEESVDPVRDIDLINSELILKDLETIGSRVSSLGGQARTTTDQGIKQIHNTLIELQDHLNDGKLAKDFTYDKSNTDIAEEINSMQLLTSKPVIFLVNVEETHEKQAVEKVREVVGDNSTIIPMDIKLEAEIAMLDAEEQKQYLAELGMQEPALARLTREAYKLLGLISFFTAGEQEVRAWTIKQGSLSPQAAGVIHTDFEKKFITSEVVSYADFVASGGWQAARSTGKVKLGGKDYLVQDGDVMLFKHNA